MHFNRSCYNFIDSLLNINCPVAASVNTIEVKIENPKKGRYYKLLSTSNENTIDSKLTDSDGLINFDISDSKKEIGKCFFVYDGGESYPNRRKNI